MNPWQLGQQIKHKLESVVWPTGAGEKVFGTNAVRISSGTPSQEQIPGAFPAALVSLGGGSPDPDDPDLISQSLSVTAMVSVTGDPMGENAIIGSSVSNLGKSVGRGMAEVSERVRFALQDLTGADGANILVTATDIDSPTTLGSAHFVYEDFRMGALCTSQLHYAAPQQIKLTSTAAWTWEGAHCSDRFDFKQYRFYEHTSIMNGVGTAASGTPTLKYTGTTAAATVTKVTDRYYHAFADYSSRKQSGVVEGSSDVEVGSYMVGA